MTSLSIGIVVSLKLDQPNFVDEHVESHMAKRNKEEPCGHCILVYFVERCLEEGKKNKKNHIFIS